MLFIKLQNDGTKLERVFYVKLCLEIEYQATKNWFKFFVMTTITASLSIALQIFNRISNWTPSYLLQLKKNSHLYKCWERKMGKLFNFLMNFTTTIHKGVFQKNFKAKSFIILFKRTKKLARHVIKEGPPLSFLWIRIYKN